MRRSRIKPNPAPRRTPILILFIIFPRLTLENETVKKTASCREPIIRAFGKMVFLNQSIALLKHLDGVFRVLLRPTSHVQPDISTATRIRVLPASGYRAGRNREELHQTASSSSAFISGAVTAWSVAPGWPGPVQKSPPAAGSARGTCSTLPSRNPHPEYGCGPRSGLSRYCSGC